MTTVFIRPIESKARRIWLAPLLLACHAQKIAPAAIAAVSEPRPAASAASRVPVAKVNVIDAPRRLAPALLLLSIDGLMPSQVLQSQTLGAQVPNLRQLVEQGAYATGVRTVVPSLTYPAHTTLITGASPTQHGILGNIVFDPTGTNKEGWYWYTDAISVPTLWSEARRARYVTANVCWPVSVGAPVDHNVVQFWRATQAEDAPLYRSLSTPGLLAELERAVSLLPYGEDYSPEADAVRAQLAEYVIAHKHPGFMTAYLGSLDQAEHETGPNSPWSIEVLNQIDAHVGRLRAALEADAPGRAVMAIVSDHGFVPYHVEIELGVLLRNKRLIEFNADESVRSWRAAAWTAGGTAAIILRDPNDASARPIVEQLISEVAQDPSYGVERVYRKSEIRELQGFSNADFVLALKPGFKFGRKLRGPVLVRRIGGTHGYLPTVADMDAAFFIAGPGIARGRSLGRIDMRDVAPTLASILSIELPRAEGRDVLSMPPATNE